MSIWQAMAKLCLGIVACCQNAFIPLALVKLAHMEEEALTDQPTERPAVSGEPAEPGEPVELAESGAPAKPAEPVKPAYGSWYAVRVMTGDEDRACEKIREADESGAIEAVFVPRCAYGVYDEQAQAWDPVERIMFPGYLIAIVKSKHLADMESVLYGAKTYARALGTEQGAVRLSDGEVAFLDEFTKRGHRAIPVSEGRIEEGGQVVVTDGPLVGKEAQIVKIKHRQKRAVVRMRWFGRETETELGLHLVRSRKASA